MTQRSFRSRLGLLKRRNFTALWLAQAVSLLGDRLTQVATAVLGTQISGGSAMVFAFMWSAPQIPPILFGWAAGVLVDRWDKRRVMIMADLLRGLLILSLTLVHSAWGLFLVSLGVAALTAFFEPALMSLVPRTVEEDEILEANSLIESTNSFMWVVGTGLAAVIIAWMGANLAFTLDFVSYLLSAAAIATVTVRTRPSAEALASGFWSDFRAGVRYHRENRPVLDLLFLITGLTLSIGVYNVLTPLTLERMLGRPTSDWGWLMTSQSVAMTLGGIWLGGFGHRFERLRLVALSYLAFALPVAGVALSHSFTVSLGLYAVAGLINVVQLVATTSWVQEVTAPEMLGRVFAVRRTFGNISILVTTLLSGFLADRIGLPPVLFVAALFSVATGLAAFFLPGLRASSRKLALRAAAAAAAESAAAGASDAAESAGAGAAL